MEKIRRNRAMTTQRIVTAFEEVLAERGIEGAGINRIAEKAGVSKVLIYRYFGGMEGLVTHYIKMGKLFPTFDSRMLEQIQPTHPSDLGRVWARQVVQTFRGFRASKAGREILKATVIDNDELASVASKMQDEEMSRMVAELSFVEGADTQAIAAVMLGAMTHLTLLAQSNRTMIGLDLRDDENWKRIEQAVKTIYAGLNQLATESETVHFNLRPSTVPVGQW